MIPQNLFCDVRTKEEGERERHREREGEREKERQREAETDANVDSDTKPGHLKVKILIQPLDTYK